MNRIQPKRPRQRLDPDLYERLREQVLRRDAWKCQCCGTRVRRRRFRAEPDCPLRCVSLISAPWHQKLGLSHKTEVTSFQAAVHLRAQEIRMWGVRYLLIMKLIAILDACLRSNSVLSVRPLLPALVLCLITSSVLALQPSDVPTFRVRARLLSRGGMDPTGHKFPIHLQTLSGEADGKDWSPWLVPSVEITGTLSESIPQKLAAGSTSSDKRHFGSKPRCGRA